MPRSAGRDYDSSDSSSSSDSEGNSYGGRVGGGDYDEENEQSSCYTFCCEFIPSIPFMSYATAALSFIMIGKFLNTFSDLEDVLNEYFEIKDAKPILRWSLAGILIFDITVCVLSTFASEYCFYNLCSRKSGEKSCCRSCLECFQKTTAWVLLWFCFIGSYLVVIAAVLMQLVSTLLPYTVLLMNSACEPLLEDSAAASPTTPAATQMLDSFFDVLETAEQHDEVAKWLSVHKPANDDEYLEFCRVLEANEGNTQDLFVWAIIVLFLQINIVVISRGNLVAYNTWFDTVSKKYKGNAFSSLTDGHGEDGKGKVNMVPSSRV